MAGLSVLCRYFRPGAVCLVLLQLPNLAAAVDEPWLPLRTNNPFLQVFGLPQYQAGATAAAGEWTYSISLDVANHADASGKPEESVVLDGESYLLTLSLRHGLSDRVQVGVDLPFIAYSGGFLDAPIENWHDLWGLSNTKRSGPRNQLHFLYDNSDSAFFEVDSATQGIGDLRLSTTMRFGGRDKDASRAVGLRAGIKFPTGDASRLHGSGAIDYSMNLYAADSETFAEHRISTSAFIGLLILGKGDVLPNLQRKSVGFGGIAASWQATTRFGITAQLNVQSPYYDSGLHELGGSSTQLAVGGHYHLPGQGLTLKFAVVEDIFGNATADFALHFSVQGFLRASSDNSQ